MTRSLPLLAVLGLAACAPPPSTPLSSVAVADGVDPEVRDTIDRARPEIERSVPSGFTLVMLQPRGRHFELQRNERTSVVIERSVLAWVGLERGGTCWLTAVWVKQPAMGAGFGAIHASYLDLFSGSVDGGPYFRRTGMLPANASPEVISVGQGMAARIGCGAWSR